MNLLSIYLTTVILIPYFNATKFKRYDKTNLMTAEFGQGKVFDQSIKTSLINCLGQCMAWPGTGSSKKICNAAMYDKKSGQCLIAELDALIDTSSISSSKVTVNISELLCTKRYEILSIHLFLDNICGEYNPTNTENSQFKLA